MQMDLWKSEFDEETGVAVLQFRDSLPVGHPDPVNWRSSKSVYVTLSGLGVLVPDLVADPEPEPEPEPEPAEPEPEPEP